MNKGTHIIAGTKEGRLNIWNSQSGRLIADASAHFETIKHISLSTDDSLILSASSGGSVKLWIVWDLIEASENKLTQTQDVFLKTEAESIAEYKGHTNQITGAIINKFRTRVYTSSDDKTCRIWDLFSGTEIKTITCISPIRWMQVDQIESTVYLGCKNKNVYWYWIDAVLSDINSKKSSKVLNAHKNEITTMALTKNERYLVVGNTDGVLYIWDLFEDDEFKTLERHKDFGGITNIVPITKPIWMFGLSIIKDSPKIPFLMVNLSETKLDKAVTMKDENFNDEYLCITENLDLESTFSCCKKCLLKSEAKIDNDYWENVEMDF